MAQILPPEVTRPEATEFPTRRNTQQMRDAADLMMVEHFDLALTHDMCDGLPDAFDRVLIASSRFYEMYAKHKINWIPARIDE